MTGLGRWSHEQVLHSHNQLYVCMHTRGNIVNTIMKNGHNSLEKYTSHTLFEMVRKGYERVMCERWVGNWAETARYWLLALLAIAALLSHPAGQLNLRAELSAVSGSHCFELQQLTPNSDLQLTELPVAPGYIIVCRPPASCERHICTEFNPSPVKAIPWYLRPDAPFPWLTAGSICYTGGISTIHIGEWDAETFLGFWYTNRSHNLGQTSRPGDSQQEQKREAAE